MKSNASNVAEQVTLFDGVTTTVVSEGGLYNYTAGDPGILDTTYVNTFVNISQGFVIVAMDNMPLDLSTLSFPGSGTYDVVASDINFQLSVTVPPLSGLVFTGDFGVQTVIAGGESVSFNFFPFYGTPTLTTTLMDTSWTLKDQFDTVITTGTLPISNLRSLWATYALSGNTPYTMTASGLTFTITRSGG